MGEESCIKLCEQIGSEISWGLMLTEQCHDLTDLPYLNAGIECFMISSKSD